MRLNQSEQVYWLNEGYPPKPADLQSGTPKLHDDAKDSSSVLRAERF